MRPGAGDPFDLVVEEIDRARVDVIHPMATEYTSRGDGPSEQDRALKRIAVEASECGRLRVGDRGGDHQ
ncbi:MAG: hypothetical protein R3B97_01505 [Dehalococcoidia bacterium]